MAGLAGWSSGGGGGGRRSERGFQGSAWEVETKPVPPHRHEGTGLGDSVEKSLKQWEGSVG